MAEAEIKVEKGIPIPPAARNGGRPKCAPRYPWREMEIGDSFLVSGLPQSTVITNARSAEKHIGSGIQFLSRKVDDGSAIRVWRVS